MIILENSAYDYLAQYFKLQITSKIFLIYSALYFKLHITSKIYVRLYHKVLPDSVINTERAFSSFPSPREIPTNKQ